MKFVEDLALASLGDDKTETILLIGRIEARASTYFVAYSAAEIANVNSPLPGSFRPVE